jgi:hypothetical protein
VSPWLRNTLEVELAPGHVNLVHRERGLTRRGLRTTLRNERLRVEDAHDAAVWHGAVQALQAALPDRAGRPHHVRVILSSHLVRYTLVPWSDALSDAAEEEAYARHCFERVHGEAAAQWELRVSADCAGAPMLASAVDAQLLNALRDGFAAAGVRLDSIQPRLMAVCNDYRRRLQGRHAWLALLEPGRLCLALRQQGGWARVRSMRIGPGWREELALLLEREAYLADPGAAARDVFVWVSGLGEVKLPESGHWQFHLLAAPPQRGIAPADAVRVLAAMGG